MRMNKIFLLCCLFAADNLLAQQLPVPANIANAFETGTRSKDGKPGKNYWQNTATYDINVNFDPATRLLAGSETIRYKNNSSDTLKEILFKLYPNLYKKGSPRLQPIQPEDAGDGVTVKTISSGAQSLSYRTSGTNMSVKIKPLAPGGEIPFDISFEYILNKTSHMRTGEVDSGSYFIAYYFPRIAVYDDIDGWNRNPYLGTQEFYNDFCDFKTAITVPAKYIVWATGDHTNSSDIFSPKYQQRIREAETKDGYVDIIDSADLAAGGITKNTTGNNTWIFESKNVTDAVFALSDHYLWQSSSLVVDKSTGRRTRVDAVFNPQHKDYFHVVSDARKTVDAMSYRFPKWPFPYNHETVFDGLDQMEYPMMVNDNPVEDRAESIELTDHEIFHTMFPFYMGINETKYGWMDEGWATLGEWLISPMIDSSIVDLYGVAPYARSAGTEIDLPITTLTTQEYGTSMFLNSYPKPAMGYLYVKDLLGEDLFYKALHTYIRNWNGKHPVPQDFFNSMNAGSGRNLNWFWKRWFYEDGVPDMAITKFNGSGANKQVVVEAQGVKPLPIDLTIFYKDGTQQAIHRTIAVWEKGAKSVTIPFKATKAIEKIVLGSAHTPDSNPKDNVWVVK
ncbi:M1 family peptidase [Ferruginibacter sp. HRS2-29]|nr:M1 family peptidase [Ferruginibacter sp. HRS2-29]